MPYSPASKLLQAGSDLETQAIFRMIENAKQEALNGSAMHAQMLVNVLKVEGGKETLWAMTNARQRRIIFAEAKNWRPPA